MKTGSRITLLVIVYSFRFIDNLYKGALYKKPLNNIFNLKTMATKL